MRRSWLGRIMVATWGVWLGVALLEPPALHACAMHDTMHGAPDHAATHDSAAHSPRDAGDRSNQSPRGSHDSRCTCIGSCCAAVAAALRTPPAVMVAATVHLAPVVVATRLTTFRPSPPEYVRPPSQGPPLGAA